MSVWSVKIFEDGREYRQNRHPKEGERKKKSAQESRVGMKGEGRKRRVRERDREREGEGEEKEAECIHNFHSN